MAIDRAAALRNAEKLLRQGKLDQAIAEYVSVVDDQPTDWNTRNTLGDLHARAGQIDRAVAEYTRIADAFRHDGFVSKAGALYRKILKLKPDDEHALLQGAEIAAGQGLLLDARGALHAVIERRRARGDHAGALTLVVRLGALDASDVDARIAGAEAAASLGDAAGALTLLKTLAAELESRQDARAVRVWDVAVRLAPHDVGLSMMAVEAQLARAPHDVNALARLVELLVDAGHEDRLPGTQARLAEAHLVSGAVTEARWIAEDLVARYPDDESHVARLRRVLNAAGEGDVDTLVARLRSASPMADAFEPKAALESINVPPGVGALPPVVRDEAETDVPPPFVPQPESATVAQRADSKSPPAPLPTDRVTATVAQAQHRSPHIEVDLSVVLDQIHKPPPASPPSADLDDVFAQMREEARRRIALEAAEQDYKRGVVLFTAGQVEESVAALESAAKAPRFRFEAAALLGRIFLNRGDLARAIEWLDRAAEAPASSPAEHHKVLYNLADALESAGETSRALAVSLELRTAAGPFRDIAARISRLSKTQARG